MIKETIQDAREHMEKTIEALHIDLRRHPHRSRLAGAGRAPPGRILRHPTPLNQLAGTTVPEPRLLVIRPWDRNTIGIIEKAILKSDLGLKPNNDGQVIRLVIPQLTEERRRDLSKQVAKRVEEARVSARNIRRDAIDMLRDLEKEKMINEDDLYEARDKVQELTDDFIKQIDEIGKAKEAEILEG